MAIYVDIHDDGTYSIINRDDNSEQQKKERYKRIQELAERIQTAIYDFMKECDENEETLRFEDVYAAMTAPEVIKYQLTGISQNKDVNDLVVRFFNATDCITNDEEYSIKVYAAAMLFLNGFANANIDKIK